MKKKKAIRYLNLVLLLILVHCSFAKPRHRSRPVLQEKARLEKTKMRLQERNPDRVRPETEEDLKKERDRSPADRNPKKPDASENNGKQKPVAPEFKRRPDSLKDHISPDRKKPPVVKPKPPVVKPKPPVVKPKPPVVKPKPPVVKPKPPVVKPKPPVVKPKQPVVKPKPPVVKPKPPVVKPKPPVVKPKPPRFKQNDRFPYLFRGSPGSHQRDNHYNRYPVRRYRGSSYFYPHFPRDYYDSWILVDRNTTYTRLQLPEQMRIQVTCGNYVEFELEENPDTAYQWMASYDAWYSRIDIIHPPKEDKSLLQFLFSKPGKATVQIEALNPGSTMVELFYIRPWEFERGDNPAKRLQLYLDIAP